MEVEEQHALVGEVVEHGQLTYAVEKVVSTSHRQSSPFAQVLVLEVQVVLSWAQRSELEVQRGLSLGSDMDRNHRPEVSLAPEALVEVADPLTVASLMAPLVAAAEGLL